MAAENSAYVVRDDGSAQPPRQRLLQALYPHDLGVTSGDCSVAVAALEEAVDVVDPVQAVVVQAQDDLSSRWASNSDLSSTVE